MDTELTKAQDLINQGSAIYSTGDFSTAREYFEKALVEDPMSYEAYVDVAQTFIMEDELGKAKDNLKKAMLIDKKAPEGYFHFGNIAMLEGNSEEAKEYYVKALNCGYNEVEIYTNLAADAEEKELYEEALGYYDKIIAKDKMNAYAKIRKTQIFIILNKLPEALKASESLMETIPDSVVPYQLKFSVLCDMKKTAEAEETLTIALKKFPDDEQLKFDKVILLDMKDDPDGALAALEEVEMNEDTEPLIVVKKARILLSALRIDDAIAVLEPYYAKSGDSEAGYLLSTVYMAKKEYKKVVDFSEKIIELKEYDDYYFSAVYMRATALYRSEAPGSAGALREANKIFRAACAKEPGQIQYYLYRAVCHKELGEFTESIEMLDFILHIAPGMAEAYYLRSEVNRELGHLEKAQSDREKAINLKPDIAELLE